MNSRSQFNAEGYSDGSEATDQHASVVNYPLLGFGHDRAVSGRVEGPIERLAWADSYTRMHAVLACRKRRDFFEILGHEWSGCDNIANHQRSIRRAFRRRPPECWPVPEAMSAAEWDFYNALPRSLAVWRGCFAHNVNGMSWSIDREVAARFPSLNRYSHVGSRPLLVEGRISKARIAFVKLDRKEAEVVTFPEFVRQRFVWLL